MSNFCTQCGRELRANAGFCENCGAPIGRPIPRPQNVSRPAQAGSPYSQQTPPTGGYGQQNNPGGQYNPQWNNPNAQYNPQWGAPVAAKRRTIWPFFVIGGVVLAVIIALCVFFVVRRNSGSASLKELAAAFQADGQITSCDIELSMDGDSVTLRYYEEDDMAYLEYEDYGYMLWSGDVSNSSLPTAMLGTVVGDDLSALTGLTENWDLVSTMVGNTKIVKNLKKDLTSPSALKNVLGYSTSSSRAGTVHSFNPDFPALMNILVEDLAPLSDMAALGGVSDFEDFADEVDDFADEWYKNGYEMLVDFTVSREGFLTGMSVAGVEDGTAETVLEITLSDISTESSSGLLGR